MPQHFLWLISLVAIVACNSNSPTPIKPEAAPLSASNSTGNRYQYGDKLTVLAKAGLVLREKPDPAASKIVTIPFGQKVTIVENPGAVFQVEVFSGFNINGNWVKVNSNDKVGYVFDGFLSKLGTPDKTPFDGLMKNAQSTGKTAVDLAGKSAEEPGILFKETETFDNGVSCETKAFEGGATLIERFPTSLLSIQEAFLLVNAAPYKGNWVFETSNGSIRYDAADEMSAISIKKEGNYTVVTTQTAD